MKVINKGDTLYWARIHHETGIYDLCELYIRTVYPKSFVGIDKRTKQTFILNYELCDEFVFEDRDQALKVVKQAEQNRREFTTCEPEDS